MTFELLASELAAPTDSPTVNASDDSTRDRLLRPGLGSEEPLGPHRHGRDVSLHGMDRGWFQGFKDAWFDSFSAADLPIWKVIRRSKDQSAREPITEELSWQEA